MISLVILWVVPRRFRTCLCFSALLILFFLFTGYLYSYQKAQSSMGKPVIVIDPGHGGVDGGTSDEQGVLEKAINLAIALRIRDYLQPNGVNVVLTRTTDTDLSPFVPGKTGRHRRDLAARIKKAKEVKALFLVSIHCDWSPDQKRRGAVVFYNPHSTAGKKLAAAIQEKLNKIQAVPRKEVPGRYFIITRSEVTGVLVEAGFLSHPEEAGLLRDPVYQDRLARAVAAGILRFCREQASTTTG